jgi:LysR family hydrogen peroxide-inducible transcriptional activator
MITLIQLEYIIAVDNHRHFASAAEKCFVTQPTLSMQIKKLEDDLGITIFDRSKQPIVPTETGKKIIEQARTVLAETQRINEIIENEKTEIQGDISIAIIPSLAPYLLPLFIGTIKKKYPGVNITVKEALSEEIIQYLKKDEIDVGILVTPLHEKGIQEHILFYEEILVYINEDHRFYDKALVEQMDIAAPDIWLLSEGHCFRSQALNLCSWHESEHHDLPFEYASGSLETIKKIVDKEGGFTLLPELAVEEFSEKHKRFTEPKPLREVSLVYSRNFVKEALLKILADEIIASVPEEMLSKDRGSIVEWR